MLQVEELQSKLTGLVREKADALSLKKQIEEQYNILTAQLKAKVNIAEYLCLSFVMCHKQSKLLVYGPVINSVSFMYCM